MNALIEKNQMPENYIKLKAGFFLKLKIILWFLKCEKFSQNDTNGILNFIY